MRATTQSVTDLALTTDLLIEEFSSGPWAAWLRSVAFRDKAHNLALLLQSWNVRGFLLPHDNQLAVRYARLTACNEVVETWQRLPTSDTAGRLMAETPTGAPTGAPADTPPIDPALVQPPIRQLTSPELAAEFQTNDRISATHGFTAYQAGLEIPRSNGMDPPLGVLTTAPTRLGHLHQANDIDGVIHHHKLLVRYRDRWFLSLPPARYVVAHRAQALALHDTTLHLNTKRIPLQDDASVAIRCTLPKGTDSVGAYEISRSQTLLDEGKPATLSNDLLKGKSVIVSAVAHSLRDLRVSPVDKSHLGAAINANVIDNLESVRFIVRIPDTLDALITLTCCPLLPVFIVLLWISIGHGGNILGAVILSAAIML